MGSLLTIKHHENGIYYLMSSANGTTGYRETGKERTFLEVPCLSSPNLGQAGGPPESAGG